ncbi:MAG: succinyldiaminopimelate transaminase [Rhodocyclaceae bacterium]|nr:succinyldiaminopimelate transaminase [Rhodocyclaceae bacterium]
MNPNLDKLQPYPFERLRELFADSTPPDGLQEIRLHIGEPQHPTPQFIKDALAANFAGLANYPTTNGSDELRQSIADWIGRRFTIPALDSVTQVLPVTGSREALFAIAQTVIEAKHTKPVVISPNPFYQIYEGAALLAGARPFFMNTTPENGFRMDWARVPEEIWQHCQLVYVCSPGNPTGKVMTRDEWQTLFDLSDRYNFVIAADECYSEIYFDEKNPPLGGLQAAHQLGRTDYRNLLMFSSLSKRSNVPGMRSGFVAGDAAILRKFWLYRTYQGCAMSPPIQAASAAAWRDEVHVRDNRSLYVEKFRQVTPIIAQHLPTALPDAGFYLWASVAATGLSDTAFARELHRQYNVTVLPGSYLARDAAGSNPGSNFIRIALVAGVEECRAAARRIDAFCQSL